MEGILEIEPRQVPFRGLIDRQHFVEARLEPEYREEDVMEMKPGPGGGKPKRRKTGTQLVATGRLHVKITCDNNQGYLLTYADEPHAQAMYRSIYHAVGNGGGYCTDMTPEEIAEQQQPDPAEGHQQLNLPEDGTGKTYHVESNDQQGGVTAGEVNVNPEPDEPPPTVEELKDAGVVEGISDRAAAEVEAEGYAAEPEFAVNQYQCKNCGHEYEFECADPTFEISCPECDVANAPVEADLLA